MSVQAAIAAWLLWLTVDTFTPPDAPKSAYYFTTVAILALATPLGFYAGMQMPDVLVAFALLGTGLILFSSTSLALRLALVAITAACASTHATAPLVCLSGFTGIALSAFVMFGRSAWRWRDRFLWALAPVGLTLLASAAFQIATSLLFGAAPQSPPYLMARIVADEPGRTYLKTACAQNPHAYVLCKFKDRSFASSDAFLWSGDPAVGVFSIADYTTRRALKQEELAFAAATILRYPLWQLQVSTEHSVHQLLTFGLDEFRIEKQSWNEGSFAEVVPEFGPSIKASLAYGGAFPAQPIDTFYKLIVIISLAWLLFWLGRIVQWRHAADKGANENEWTLWVIAGAGLLVALLGNAAVCGVISGAVDRYESRLIWLVPLFALLVAFNVFESTRHGGHFP